MIASCKTCHRMFDTTAEDACHPDGTECPRCYRKARGMPPHPDWPELDKDDDLPDTDVIEGDDPDLYIPD